MSTSQKRLISEDEQEAVKESLIMTSNGVRQAIKELGFLHIPPSAMEDLLYRKNFRKCADCGSWCEFVRDEHCEPCADTKWQPA